MGMGVEEKTLPLQMRLREAWAKSTDTPLRFFVHLLFIIEGALGIVLIFGIIYKLESSILVFIIEALIGLGAFTLLLVFILVAFFPKNLVFDKHAHLIEKALTYGDETHVLAYAKLIAIQPVEAPKEITDKTKDEIK